MKLCYNKIMKIIIRLFFVFIFLISAAYAITFDVLVVPSDLFQTKENYYSFEEASEIYSSDIVKMFNNTNGKVKSPNLYDVRAYYSKNPQLKQNLQDALIKYRNSGSIDYSAFKLAGDSFGCKSVLIVSSYAMKKKKKKKRSIWEVLEVSTAFEIAYPYRMETSVVLLDTVNNIVMWSNNYSSKLGGNDNIFGAKNYAQANDQLEKVKLYSKTVVAPSVVQNILLRFFPKTVKPVETEVKDTGGALRYDTRTLPQRPKKNTNDVPYTGDLLYEF